MRLQARQAITMAVSSNNTWGWSHSALARPMPMAELSRAATAPVRAMTATACRPGQRRLAAATATASTAAASRYEAANPDRRADAPCTPMGSASPSTSRKVMMAPTVCAAWTATS